MNISELYQKYKQSYKVSTDTRKIDENCLFFALKGANFNGNKFAKDALTKGASYVIIDEIEYKENDENYILVDNVLETLQQLAKYHRNQLAIPIISLTGSNGKTTTKELINSVLSKKYNTTATQGNLNNHIGVPLTLLSMKPDTQLGIVEMGANHLKEIEFLCSIAEPDFGYITNFGKAHLEGFGSLEGVVKGKTEMYVHLRNNNKIVFVNSGDAKQLENSNGIKRVSFGETSADTIVKLISADPLVTAKYKNLLIQSNLIGAYNFNNISAAIAIGHYFDVDDNLIKEAIEGYVPSNNRSQIINIKTNKIILDAYNANPTSMEVAIQNLSKLSDNKKVAILGDMFELGDTTKEEHQKIAELAASLKIDTVFLLGSFFNEVNVDTTKVKTFKTLEKFKEYLTTEPIQHSSVLIKGSRGMALERILDFI